MLRFIPNIITCLRLLLVGPVIYALLHKYYLLTLYLFALAGISDALDGLLARLCGWKSRFGAIVDPIADKVLLISSFIALYWLDLVPIWLVVTVIIRDITIILGVVGYRFFIGRTEIVPSVISKINTDLQVLLVPLILIDLSVFPLPPLLLRSLMFGIMATCIISLVHYAWVWSLRAMKNQVHKINREVV